MAVITRIGAYGGPRQRYGDFTGKAELEIWTVQADDSTTWSDQADDSTTWTDQTNDSTTWTDQ